MLLSANTLAISRIVITFSLSRSEKPSRKRCIHLVPQTMDVQAVSRIAQLIASSPKRSISLLLYPVNSTTFSVARSQEMVSLFQFLLFRSSEWQKISAESTFRGIHFDPTSKVNSAESLFRSSYCSHENNGFRGFCGFRGIHLALI